MSSEQSQPTPEEIDAQATDAAKNMVDSRSDLMAEAAAIKTKHDESVEKRDEAYHSAKQHGNLAQSYRNFNSNSGSDSLDWGPSDEAAKLTGYALEERRTGNKAEVSRKASLMQAEEHYDANQEQYKTAAIEDANAAGHDIKYDGVEYPAQPPETPPTPEEPQDPQAA